MITAQCCFISCIRSRRRIFPSAVDAKNAEPIRYRLGDRLASVQGTDEVYTLMPPGEYDGTICTAAQMRPVATVTVPTC